jgi:hypothetical protein
MPTHNEAFQGFSATVAKIHKILGRSLRAQGGDGIRFVWAGDACGQDAEYKEYQID